MHFISLGNELKPEQSAQSYASEDYFISLGNELKPERCGCVRFGPYDFISLGNELKPEQRSRFCASALLHGILYR